MYSSALSLTSPIRSGDHEQTPEHAPSPAGQRKGSAISRQFILVLIASLFGEILSASQFSTFPIIANPLKKKFLINQQKLDTLGSLLSIGGATTMIAGYLLDRYGSVVTLLVGTGSFNLFLGLLLLSTYTVAFHVENNAIFFLYFILSSIGSFWMESACTVSSLDRTSVERKGMVAGLLGCAYTFPTGLVPLVYMLAFSGGHSRDEENQNLSGFFLAWLCSSILISVGLLAFVRKPATVHRESLANRPDGEEQHVELTAAGEQHDGAANHVDHDERQKRSISMREWLVGTVFTADFQCLVWSHLLMSGLEVTYSLNFASLLASFHLQDYLLTIMLLYFAAMFVVNVPFTLFSDKLVARGMPRMVPCLVCQAIQTTIITSQYFFLDNLTSLMLFSTSLGLDAAASWLTVSAHFAHVYPAVLGRSWALVMCANFCIATAYQQVFALIYTVNIDPSAALINATTTTANSTSLSDLTGYNHTHVSSAHAEELFCYGFECYRLSIILSIPIAFLATFLMGVATIRNWRQNRRANLRMSESRLGEYN